MNQYFWDLEYPVMSIIAHHGIKGQKWGVRRFQNPDGSLTKEGTIRLKARNRIIRGEKTRSKVNEIIGTLNDEQKHFLNIDPDGEYLTFEQQEYLAKRILIEVEDKPIAFLDFLIDGTNKQGKENLSIATAVRSDYQGKGYGTEIAKKANEWVDKHMDEYGYIEWAAKADNKSSQHVAEKMGWKRSNLSDDKWAVYRKSKRKGSV